jgi:glycolate oxidase
MLQPEIKREFEKLLDRDSFSTRPEDLVLYGSDATNDSRTRPDAVAWPRTEDEVARLVRLARRHGVPVIPRGTGSGLTGGALPVAGGIIVVMTRFNRIIEIDAGNLVAEVEPGVITGRLQAEAEKYGLFYPPDPASRDYCTLGGNVAENAGGTRAVKYGVTRDYVLGLTAVIGTGEIVKTGVRTAKGVVGYDLTRLLVGSEGTLGIITHLILRLLPKPETAETVVAYFKDLTDVAKTVAALTAAKVVPATLEFMDQASIACVEQYLHMGLDVTAGGLLLIETDGPAAQAKAEAEIVTNFCERNGAISVRRAENQAEAGVMWRARRVLASATYRVASGKMNEDIVVPRSRIPEMIERTAQVSSKFGLKIINFGHAGDGNIHVSVMYETKNPVQVAKAHAAVRDVFTHTLELGGTISGEHGIGTAKKDFIALEISSEGLDLMERIKLAFDPDGIMNPGKIFPPRERRLALEQK